MMKIRAMQRRYDEAEKWAELAFGNRRAKWSVEWMRLKAADEVVRGGGKQEAEVVLLDLWQNDHYEPARRRLLELGYRLPPG